MKTFFLIALVLASFSGTGQTRYVTYDSVGADSIRVYNDFNVVYKINCPIDQWAIGRRTLYVFSVPVCNEPYSGNANGSTYYFVRHRKRWIIGPFNYRVIITSYGILLIL